MVSVCTHKEMNNYPTAKSHSNHSRGICEPWSEVKYSLLPLLDFHFLFIQLTFHR